MCWEPVSAHTCCVKHKCEQDLQDECASISVFRHFRGDPDRCFSTRAIANASLEILYFCYLVFLLLSGVCVVQSCLFLFFFFNPMLPRCLSKSLLHILLLPFSPLHCVMQGCNTLLAKMRKDGSEVLGTASQRLVILVVSRTRFSVYLTYIHCFEFMRQACCL